MPSRVPNLPPNDALQPLFVEVLLVDGTTGDTLSLQGDFFESLTLTISEESAWKANLTLFDRAGDFILGILAASGRSRRVRFRFGWDEGLGIEDWPQFDATYMVYTPTFTAEGTRIELELIPTPMYRSFLNRRPRSFPANTRISDIVLQLAEEHEWNTRRTDDSAFTIEPTKSVLTDELVMRGESNFRFMKQTLLKRAESVTPGRGNYKMYFDRDGVFHFHTNEFLPKTDVIAANYTFAQDAMGDVISFAPSDLKIIASIFGSANAVHWSVDSLTGKRLRLASTDLAGLPGPQQVIDASAAFQSDIFVVPEDIPDEWIQAHFPMVARDEEDFEQKVRARFNNIRRYQYQATAEVRGTHAVRPQDLITMAFFTAKRQEPHFLSGTFRVNTVEHSVNSSGWQTSFEMYRPGITKAQGAKPATNVVKTEAKEDASTQGTDELRAGGTRRRGRTIAVSVRSGDGS